MGDRLAPRTDAQAIASSTLWQVASQVLMAALSIVTVKFVAMGLSKELAGQYNTAYGYLQLFGILADFGLYAVAVREVSKAKDRERVLGALIVLRLLILAVSLGTALAIAWLMPHWKGSPLPLGISIAALVPAFTLAAGMLRTVFQVGHRMQYVFVAEVFQRIITVALIGSVIAGGVRGTEDAGTYWLFLAFGSVGAAELLLVSFLFARRLQRIRMHWDAALLRRLFLLAAPYGVAFLCTALYRQFDVTLISMLRPQDFQLQNAYYGFVQRMMDMAYLLPTFLLNSALPILSERDGQGEDTRGLLGKTLLAILILGSTAALFGALWPRPLVGLLTTQAYLSAPGQPGSDTALRLLAFPMFLNGIVVYSFYVLLTRHRWKPLVASLTLGVFLSLALNVALIPSQGFVGAAITSIITHTFLAALLLPQALRTMPARFGRKELSQWLLYALGLGLLLFLLSPFLLTAYHTLLFGAVTALGMAGLVWGLGLGKALGVGVAAPAIQE
ncbi:MAG: oligosaccharide flippase family protein [Candidatus Peribacteraceae bacterium]